MTKNILTWHYLRESTNPFVFPSVLNDTKNTTFPRLSALPQFIGDLLSISVCRISPKDSIYLEKKTLAGSSSSVKKKKKLEFCHVYYVGPDLFSEGHVLATKQQ